MLRPKVDVKEFEKYGFKKCKGSYICREILGCDISTDEGRNYARSNGLYGKYCTEMVRTAAEIVAKMLGDDE